MGGGRERGRDRVEQQPEIQNTSMGMTALDHTYQADEDGDDLDIMQLPHGEHAVPGVVIPAPEKKGGIEVGQVLSRDGCQVCCKRALCTLHSLRRNPKAKQITEDQNKKKARWQGVVAMLPKGFAVEPHEAGDKQGHKDPGRVVGVKRDGEQDGTEDEMFWFFKTCEKKGKAAAEK